MKKVSNHAKARCRERFNVSNKKIKEVMMYGYDPYDFDGSFRSYLCSIKNAVRGAKNVKVKGDMLVIYNKRSQIAITTYKVPEKYLPIELHLMKNNKNRKKYERALGELGEYLWAYIGGK